MANYTLSIPRTRRHHLEEVVATCRDALTDLPHDHCARYLTFMQAEACALLNDEEGLLAVWRDRRAYFDGALDKGEYFKTEEKYLLTDLPDLIKALERDDHTAYRKIRRGLRYHRLWDSVRRENLGKGARIAARIIWILLMLGIAGGILRL